MYYGARENLEYIDLITSNEENDHDVYITKGITIIPWNIDEMKITINVFNVRIRTGIYKVTFPIDDIISMELITNKYTNERDNEFFKLLKDTCKNPKSLLVETVKSDDIDEKRLRYIFDHWLKEKKPENIHS
jgi:hypothetical protein